jgi:hypothetical protein
VGLLRDVPPVSRPLINNDNPTSPTRLGDDFEHYLKIQNRRNVRQILCYVRKYASVLETGDATALTTLSSAKRRHVMEALSAYSKHIGAYPRWQQIYKSHSLRWTTDDASLIAMQRFFNPKLNLDSMLLRIKEMMRLMGGDL